MTNSPFSAKAPEKRENICPICQQKDTLTKGYVIPLYKGYSYRVGCSSCGSYVSVPEHLYYQLPER